MRPYQSLYLVPFNPTPADFVYTSKTFWPPHESDWGSSCMERRPQSVLPVMGSTGTRRRKRSFFPPGNFHAVDKRIHVRGISFRAQLLLKCVLVRRVFVTINRGPYFPKIAPQLYFALPP